MRTGYCITLGNGRRVSLAAYARAWRTVKDADPDTWVRDCPCACGGGTAAHVLRVFRRGLQDRINKRGGLRTEGRTVLLCGMPRCTRRGSRRFGHRQYGGQAFCRMHRKDQEQ